MDERWATTHGGCRTTRTCVTCTRCCRRQGWSCGMRTATTAVPTHPTCTTWSRNTETILVSQIRTQKDTSKLMAFILDDWLCVCVCVCVAIIMWSYCNEFECHQINNVTGYYFHNAVYSVGTHAQSVSYYFNAPSCFHGRSNTCHNG